MTVEISLGHLDELLERAVHTFCSEEEFKKFINSAHLVYFF